MKIKNVNSSKCRKCLSLSMSVDTMIRFARLVNPQYNIYRRTGLKEGMPISNQTAAQRIVDDLIADGYFVDFVETLVKIDSKGYMGRKYNLRGLDSVINGLINEGYSYDSVSGQFYENQRERITLNWGRLKDWDERRMTVLRMDIAGNSELVKNNSKSKIEQAYNDLRVIVYRVVTSRVGRLWSWEGDGALAVFLFGSMEKTVLYAGMEILHELYFYNRLRNPLASPINIRLGAHIGPVSYSDNEMVRMENETVREASSYESLAAKNTLCVSYNLYVTLDQNTLKLFGEEKSNRGIRHRIYSFRTEK